ncbi:MAG TPA: bifunctional DNA primase/polymerase, partial [Catenuloplanes sp.]
MPTSPPAHDLAAAARRYAARGIPVLPLHTPGDAGRCSCRRVGCERPGKHPRLRHGLCEASTEPGQLDLWWATWPTANIGLRTGVVMDVLDADTAAGWAAVRRLGIGDGPAV